MTTETGLGTRAIDFILRVRDQLNRIDHEVRFARRLNDTALEEGRARPNRLADLRHAEAIVEQAIRNLTTTRDDLRTARKTIERERG